MNGRKRGGQPGNKNAVGNRCGVLHHQDMIVKIRNEQKGEVVKVNEEQKPGTG